MLDTSPDEIVQQILNVANWPDFKGQSRSKGLCTLFAHTKSQISKSRNLASEEGDEKQGRRDISYEEMSTVSSLAGAQLGVLRCVIQKSTFAPKF